MSATCDPSPGLDSLFAAITSDIKTFNPLVEDLIGKATRLHSSLKSLIACYSAFWESFHKIADMGAQSQGCSKSLGASLSRLCTKMSSQDTKMRQLCHHLFSSLAQPLQDHLEEWKRQASQMEREHQKEHKVLRANTKRASQEVQRLQKKLEKFRSGEGAGVGGGGTGSSDIIGSGNLYAGVGSTPSMMTVSGVGSSHHHHHHHSSSMKCGPSIVKLDRAKAEYAMQHHRLVTLQREHVRRALLLDRQRYCALWDTMHPLMSCLVGLLTEMSSVDDNMQNLATLSQRADSLPEELDISLRKLLTDSCDGLMPPPSSSDDVRSSISTGTTCSKSGDASSDTVSLRSATHDWGQRLPSPVVGGSRRSSSNSLASSIQSDQASTGGGVGGGCGVVGNKLPVKLSMATAHHHHSNNDKRHQLQLQQQISQEVAASRSLRVQTTTNGVFSTTRVPSVTSQDSGIASTRDPELYGSALFLRRQISSSATTATDDPHTATDNADKLLLPSEETAAIYSEDDDNDSDNDDSSSDNESPSGHNNNTLHNNGSNPTTGAGVVGSHSHLTYIGTQRFSSSISASSNDALVFDARHTVSGASSKGMLGHHEVTRPMLSEATFHAPPLPPPPTTTMTSGSIGSAHALTDASPHGSLGGLSLASPRLTTSSRNHATMEAPPQAMTASSGQSSSSSNSSHPLQRNYSLRYPLPPAPRPTPATLSAAAGGGGTANNSQHHSAAAVNSSHPSAGHHNRRFTVPELPPGPDVTDAELTSELQALEDMLSGVSAGLDLKAETHCFAVPATPLALRPPAGQKQMPPPPPVRRGSQASLGAASFTTSQHHHHHHNFDKRGSYTPLMTHASSIPLFASQPSKFPSSSSSSSSPPTHVKPSLFPKPDVSQVIHNSSVPQANNASFMSQKNRSFSIAEVETTSTVSHSQQQQGVGSNVVLHHPTTTNSSTAEQSATSNAADSVEESDVNDAQKNPFLAALRSRNQQLKRVPMVRDRSAPAIN